MQIKDGLRFECHHFGSRYGNISVKMNLFLLYQMKYSLIITFDNLVSVNNYQMEHKKHYQTERHHLLSRLQRMYRKATLHLRRAWKFCSSNWRRYSKICSRWLKPYLQEESWMAVKLLIQWAMGWGDNWQRFSSANKFHQRLSNTLN